MSHKFTIIYIFLFPIFRICQCQIELGEVIEIYQNTLGLLAGQDVPDYPELEHQKENNRSEIICLAVKTIATFLIHQRRESLQILFIRTGIVDFLIMLLFDAKVIKLTNIYLTDQF